MGLERSHVTNGAQPSGALVCYHANMATRLFRLLKSVLLLMTVVVLTLIVARAWESQRGPPLEVWHTHVPDDMHAAQIDKADWADTSRRRRRSSATCAPR